MQTFMQINPGTGDAWVIAAIMYLYPLNMFYYYMYYTDTISTVSLVLTYGVVLKSAVRPDMRVLAKSRNATVTTWNAPVLVLMVSILASITVCLLICLVVCLFY